TSPLIEQGRLKVTMKFPYGSGCHVCPGYDWSQPDKHETKLSPSGTNHVQMERNLDTTVYYTDVRWNNEGQFSEKEKHHFELIPAKGEGSFEFSVLFSKTQEVENIPDF